MYVSTEAVEKTDTCSSQRCTAKIHKGKGIGCKSRWDEEVQPGESSISWFLHCEKLMRKENKSFINTNAGEDSSFPH